MADHASPGAERTFGFGTRAIHAGARPDPVTGARATPIHQTTSFVFDDAEHASSLFNLQTFGNVYSRISNPTVAVLEERIANLENGRAALACANARAADAPEYDRPGIGFSTSTVGRGVFVWEQGLPDGSRDRSCFGRSRVAAGDHLVAHAADCTPRETLRG